jgi:hypothetical protein
MVLAAFIAGAADENPMQLAKLSSDTWIDPEHAPAAVWAVSVAGFIAVENVTTTEVGVNTPVAASAGEVAVTVGATTQTLPWHTPVAQSAVPRQAFPIAHPGHAPPPQSTSVSAAFLTRSEHVAVWQTLIEHTKLWQSAPAPHERPLWHGGHPPPPQSMSVSVPFFTMSAQLAATHRLLAHTPLGHIELLMHWTHAPAPLHTTPPF